MSISKITMPTSLAKRTGRDIVDDAERAKLKNEEAVRQAREQGMIEVANKYGIRYREPEPPVFNRLDMLERATEPWFERVAAISKGAEIDYSDPRTRATAGARMIANMLRNPGQFGKSIFSSEFKGRVTQRELLQKIDEE
jgi:hypothetical protein